jgi:hypothetical protein
MIDTIYSDPNFLQHYGVKGMKWGVRRYQNYDGTRITNGEARYYQESDKKIKTNRDGYKIIPKGFKFNRVGKSSLDLNKSGGLYVSYGKEDASRYIKSLGPTPIRKLFKTYGDTVQHISVNSDLKVPSDTQIAKDTADVLLSNKEVLNSFGKSIYGQIFTGEFDKHVTEHDVQKALQSPSKKEIHKLSYCVNSFFGDPNYSKETKVFYDYYRSKGYDAIPDIHDRLSGTSKTAMIIINPDKVSVTSSTYITKDVMKSAKAYAKKSGKLKVSELIK